MQLQFEKWKWWRAPVFAIWALALLVGSADVAAAAELQQTTLRAWNQYVQAANQEIEVRALPGHTFLWADEDNSRLATLVEGGELQVAPVGGKGAEPVPNGLVHHWVGAVFIPHTTLEQVLRVTRDYDHYKDFFNPAVIRSQALSEAGDEDQFSVLMSTKVLFVSTGVDTTCHARGVRVDSQRYYKISSTTRVQEIQDFGKPSERRLDPDQGDGFIWRLHSINRYEARAGGVLVEIDTLALTRDIPRSVRFVVTPIVKKLSRNALLLSLDQTRSAVQSETQVAKASPRKGEYGRDGEPKSQERDNVNIFLRTLK